MRTALYVNFIYKQKANVYIYFIADDKPIKSENYDTTR